MKSMDGTGAQAVHMTNTKPPTWMIVILVVLAFWSAALTGVIISNNIKASTSHTEAELTDNSHHRRPRALCQNQSMMVAFTTKLSRSLANRRGVNQIIPYDNITLNIGNGFDGRSHKFNAPVSGIYMFTFCAFSDGANGVIRVRLMLNGHLSTTVYAAYGGYDSGCNTELFNLSAGDVVHVELIGRDSTKGLIDNTSNYITFSGHLIHQV